MSSRGTTILPPSRLKEKRRKSRVLWTIALGVVCCLCIAGLVGALYIPNVQIHEVAIVGADSVSASAIEAHVEQLLKEKYLHIFPINNVLFYSSKRIVSDVAYTYPKLSTVNVGLKNFNALTVSVTERTPAALWCGEVQPTEGDSTCYMLDSNGFSYEVAPVFSGSAYVRWYGKLNQSDPLRAQFLTEEEFRNLSSFLDVLSRLGHVPTSVEVNSVNDIYVHFAGGYQFIFTRAQHLEDVLAKIQTVEESDALKGKKINELHYLDLRFGNRLYYK